MLLLVAAHSQASSQDADESIKNSPNSTASEGGLKEIRILGQVFRQVGSGGSEDGYTGSDRVVKSDIGYGLRLGAGISWKYCMLALNGEYLQRNLKMSETPVVAIPMPSVEKNLSYQHFKVQPELTLKINVNEKIEFGVVSGFGYRNKIGNNESEVGLDESLSIGCYGQFYGVNVRLSKEKFYESMHNSESRNVAISLGYSYAFKLK